MRRIVNICRRCKKFERYMENYHCDLDKVKKGYSSLGVHYNYFINLPIPENCQMKLEQMVMMQNEEH